jgi:hypothetical protein
MLALRRRLSFFSPRIESPRSLRTTLGATESERIASLLTLALVALGLALRARGYLFDRTAFWLDECSWAMRIIERPLVQSLIRPIGFLAVSKFLALSFANTETVLRALPWLAGMVTTLAAPLLARRLYRSPAARLLFVAVIALSPFAIDFSKEFKPYSLALALHLGLILFTLRYAESRRSEELAWALGVAALGSLFAQDLVFALPGVFIVLGLVARERSRTHLVASAAVALTIVLGLALQYFLMWKYLPTDHTEFWGKKYNVFHTARDAQGYLAWSLERWQDVAAMPGMRRTQWTADWLSTDARHGLRDADEVVWTGLFVAGLAVLAWQRRYRDALLVALPLTVLWVFNRAGFWPLGAFRTNVFTLVYTGAIAAMSFDLKATEGSAWRTLAPVGLLVLVPLALFERSWHEHKRVFTYDSTFPRAIERLANTEPASPAGAPELVVLDRRSCDPWRYYTTYHPHVSRRFSADIARKYLVKCATNDADLPRELAAGAEAGRRWTVLHVTRPFDKMMRSGRFGELRVVRREDVGSHTLVALAPTSGRATAPNATNADELETSDED